MVVQSVNWTNEVIHGRHALIKEFKALAKEQQFPRLFGLALEGVGEDRRYRDCMENIWAYSNDVIYFSREICKALTSHGLRTEARFRKKFRGQHPRTSRVDFETPEVLTLWPPDANYASWEKTFVTIVPGTEGRTLKKWLYAVRKAIRKLLLKPWGRWGAPRLKA
jgi:hypothetical protein